MIDVLVLIDITNLNDKEKFEKHIVKEGFKIVQGEDFVYTGESSTSNFSTKAYILEVFSKAIQKSSCEKCNMIFLLNETPYPSYAYNDDLKVFDLVNEK